MSDIESVKRAVMKFWVRWDFVIAAPIYLVIGVMFLPSIGEGLLATGLWIVWGWIVWGSCTFIGTALSRRHPDLGKRVEPRSRSRERWHLVNKPAEAEDKGDTRPRH